MSRASLIFVFGICTGCTGINAYEDPIAVGKWELAINADSEMELDLDGDGDSTIILEEGESRFDLDWTQEGEDDFKLEFGCQAHPLGCAGRDFVMNCEASNSGDKLRCLAESGWADPSFTWKRD